MQNTMCRGKVQTHLVAGGLRLQTQITEVTPQAEQEGSLVNVTLIGFRDKEENGWKYINWETVNKKPVRCRS